LNYYDSRKWNKFETKPISGLFNGALLIDRLGWPSQNDSSKTQVGDLGESTGGEIRGLRFGVIGTINFKKPWVYTFFAATNAFDRGFDVDTTKKFTLYDYRLDIPLPAQMNLSIGKQKEPISMERLTSLLFLPWQERSAPADALLPARNHGIVLNGTAFGGRSTWAAGVFNNWIDSGKSFSDTSNQLIGRFTGIPFVSADASNLLHLGLGLRYSDTKKDFRVRTEAEFNQSPIFADTGSFPANDALTYDLEAYWRKGPYLVGFEYIGAGVDAPDSGDPHFHGYHISASWTLSGEMRSYRKGSGIFNSIRVARPVNHGGWGAWEAAFRYSTLDLTEGKLDGGEMDTVSLGFNWWLNQRAQFSLNYRYINLYRFGIKGRSSGINMRIALILD
jgi:phosphate-selective porin OprO/OprP